MDALRESAYVIMEASWALSVRLSWSDTEVRGLQGSHSRKTAMRTLEAMSASWSFTGLKLRSVSSFSIEDSLQELGSLSKTKTQPAQESEKRKGYPGEGRKILGLAVASCQLADQ